MRQRGAGLNGETAARHHRAAIVHCLVRLPALSAGQDTTLVVESRTLDVVSYDAYDEARGHAGLKEGQEAKLYCHEAIRGLHLDGNERLVS